MSLAVRSRLIFCENNDEIGIVAVNPDASEVAAIDFSGKLFVWNLKERQLRHSTQLRKSQYNCSELLYSPNGKYLAAVFDDHKYFLMDTKGNYNVCHTSHLPDRADSIRFNDTGELLLLCTNGVVSLWKSNPLQQEFVVYNDKPEARFAAYLPGSVTDFIVGCRGGTIKFVNPFSSRRPVTIDGHEGDVYQAAFNSDGNRFVTLSTAKTAAIWNTKSRKKLATLEEGIMGFYSAKFTVDGTKLITSSVADMSIWDAETGKRLLMLYYEDGIWPDIHITSSGSIIIPTVSYLGWSLISVDLSDSTKRFPAW